MAAFLSDEWLAALAEAVGGATFPAEGGQLALGQLVTGAPAGDVGYTILLGAGVPGPRVVAGTDGADVVLVSAYATARAIAAGELTAASAMADGLVKLRGDAKRLVAHESLLSPLADATATLQATTTF